jgi:hypothetical protein
MAEQALKGVGDATLGEWREMGDIAVHLRRRLTAKEQAVAGIDAVVDVRGTPEGATRIACMRPYLPASMAEWPTAKLP